MVQEFVFLNLRKCPVQKPLGRMFMDTERQPRDLLTDDQQSSAEYWQAKVERLQEAVCFLLTKNQTMRMALSAEKATEHHSASPQRHMPIAIGTLAM
jgi:hypothetical protein